jgi:phosphoserine phosphatase RsbU/P
MGQQPVWIMIALVLDAVIAVTGVFIGPSFNMAGLLAVGPLLACARCSGRMTALVAGYALALCALLAAVNGTTRSPMEGYRFGMVAVVGILAVLAAAIRSRREGALIKINERVQHAILRPLPAELGGVAFASHYQSATSAALVGGDLYDITMTQFGPRFIIGDVKGKGLDAVGRCAAVLAIFRELAFGEADLVGLAEKMDARLSRDMEIEDFVTVILAEFASGEVHMVNCGHHPPVKLAAGASCLQIMTPEGFAPPLGLHPHPAQQDIVLKPGDRLLFYTDGLVETRDRAGRFFDLGDRVATALARPALARPALARSDLVLADLALSDLARSDPALSDLALSDLARSDLVLSDLARSDLALSDLDGAVKRVVRLLLEHAGSELTDDVLLVLAEPVADVPSVT